jgi:predicted XRE-type DNA-binding protein
MVALRKLIADKGWIRAQAAGELGVTQSRNRISCGKHEKFSLDMLVTLAARAGRTVKLRLAAQPALPTIPHIARPPGPACLEVCGDQL